MRRVRHSIGVWRGLGAVLLLGWLPACVTGPEPGDFEAALRADPDLVPHHAIIPVRHRHRQCCSLTATQRQHALARTAAKFVGRTRIEIDGARFTYDCSGLARGVYYSAGIDLYEGLEHVDTANGVRLIYRYVKRHGRLHHGPTVSPGDLVFFHNTWDANRDGRFNDLLTHVGVVERVEADGTIVFLSRVSAGIERYRMNLRYPDVHRAQDGRILNDYMRRKRGHDSRFTQYLTGQLFASFGTVIS